jgi:outer membrane immunogenic protein
MNRPASALLLALVPAAALAADGPAADWQGFYAGVHLGGGRAEARWQTTALLPEGDTVDQKTDAGVSGFQLGYRFRVARSWIVGVEGDYSAARFRTFAMSGDLAKQGFDGQFRETDFRKIYALTAQVGYADPEYLLYAKAGGAASYVYRSTFDAVFGESSSLADRARGWTAGAGIEYPLKDRWSFGLEYDHYRLRLGDKDVLQSDGSIATYSGFKANIRTFVARLNHTF